MAQFSPMLQILTLVFLFLTVSSQSEFERRMHLHIGGRSLDELRCQEGYRGWLALLKMMQQIKDIKG